MMQWPATIVGKCLWVAQLSERRTAVLNILLVLRSVIITT